MGLKVAGCAGHGGFKTLNPKTYSTPGKRTPDGEPEWEFNNKVMVAFEKELLTYEDVQFLRTDDRTGKTDVPLTTRTNKANSWGADFYLSYHHNAIKGIWSDEWTGTETFTYGSGEGLAVGKLIHQAMLEAYGLRSRGMKVADLHIINKTKMPAVLAEGAFMDSTIDIKKMRDDKVLANAGKKVAQAVAKYYKLKKKQAKKEEPKVSGTTYKIQKGDTFWGIEQKYKLPAGTLKKLNPKVDETKLQIGQVITIKSEVRYYYVTGSFAEGSLGMKRFEEFMKERGYNYEKKRK